jgi:serine/threonine protein kinase
MANTEQQQEEALKQIDQLVGLDIRGWTLVKMIGHGADGVVYHGTRAGQDAAIKVFSPKSFMKNGLEEGRERLEPQLALIGKKQHPNLVEVYEGGDCPELTTLYLAMELVPGTSLDKLIGKVPGAAIPGLLEQLASAAKCLEDMGLVHRDIKPANIVISDDFTHLTLLDLSVVHYLPTPDEDDRLSGMEFVATLRYSPPEFVWREEEGDANDAWRAVTFYQIGATLHDMVMGKPLFAGQDQPRARLYDCVRDVTPNVASGEVPSWLVETTHACLLKDWRQRLQFVAWDSFRAPAAAEAQHQERRIRLLQIRKEEIRIAKAKQAVAAPGPNREQRLWHLNGALFMEIRTYLLDTSLFPRFRAAESKLGASEYVTEITFDIDESRGFAAIVSFCIRVAIDSAIPEATKLTFEAKSKDDVLVTATWTEMFSAENAFSLCRQSILDSVEQILALG